MPQSSAWHRVTLHSIVNYSVAEPERMDRQLFAGAGAFFWPGSGSGSGYVYNIKFVILKFNYFKEPFDDQLCF
jgi:hypothetical protein